MSDDPSAHEEGFYWVVLGQNPPEIAYWERGEWWLAGDARPWQPNAVNVLSDKLVFRPHGALLYRAWPSTGWAEPPAAEVTCPSCLQRLQNSSVLGGRGESVLRAGRRWPCIVAARRAGAVTLREVADAMEAREIRTPGGHARWHPATVLAVERTRQSAALKLAA